jgi:hypothetical protein
MSFRRAISRSRRAVAALLILPSVALAADEAIKPLPSWWQVATGILAIPAAVLGLVYSFFQIQKTRLETHKIALELRRAEKEIGLERLGPSVTATGTRRGRLIVIYLLLASAVIAGYTVIFSGTTLFPISMDESIIIYALIVPVFVAQLTIPLVWRRYRDFVLTGGTILVWAVTAPLVALVIFGVAMLAFVIGNLPSAPIGWGVTAQFITSAVALSVTILNVATIQIVARMIVVESGEPSID